MIRLFKIYIWLFKNHLKLLKYSWECYNGYYEDKPNDPLLVYRRGARLFKDFPK